MNRWSIMAQIADYESELKKCESSTLQEYYAQQVKHAMMKVTHFETVMINLSSKMSQDEAQMLRLRYLHALSWRNIAKRVNYSLDSCYRIRRKWLLIMAENGIEI